MQTVPGPIRETLSPRERVRLAFAHEETDRVPIAMVCSGINPPAMRTFDAWVREQMGCDARTYLGGILDIRTVGPAFTGPARDPGVDMWGVRREDTTYGEGSYQEIVGYPLASATSIDDLDAHPWPTTDWFDYPSLVDRCRELRRERNVALMITNANVFETSWYLRGFEQMFFDLLDNPEFAHALLEKVADFWYAHFRRMLEAADGEVDLAFTADDIGGQEGLLLSPDLWERFIKPCHARINAMIHEFGVKVVYHSDGAVMDAVWGLIDMGIDALQALQFSATGMDPIQLKQQYGDDVAFVGGICVQKTLPHGTVEDVEREVRERIDVLGRGGGYVLPHHRRSPDQDRSRRRLHPRHAAAAFVGMRHHRLSHTGGGFELVVDRSPVPAGFQEHLAGLREGAK